MGNPTADDNNEEDLEEDFEEAARHEALEYSAVSAAVSSPREFKDGAGQLPAAETPFSGAVGSDVIAPPGTTRRRRNTMYAYEDAFATWEILQVPDTLPSEIEMSDEEIARNVTVAALPLWLPILLAPRALLSQPGHSEAPAGALQSPQPHC